MKIIKKLCIPLFSLVLVLGCFAVSQMDASAYTSDYACPGHMVYMYLSNCVVTAKPVYLDNGYWHPHIHTYSCPVAGCIMSFDVTMDHGDPIVASILITTPPLGEHGGRFPPAHFLAKEIYHNKPYR